MLTGGITTELCPLEEVGGPVPRILTLFKVLLICKVPELLVDWDDVAVLAVLVVVLVFPLLSDSAWITAVCWSEQAWIDEACWRKNGGTLDL